MDELLHHQVELIECNNVKCEVFAWNRLIIDPTRNKYRMEKMSRETFSWHAKNESTKRISSISGS